jgi:hypothetical protein
MAKTLEELEMLEKECLTPGEVAPILGCDQYSINVQVKEDKLNGINSFPFPTMLIGNRVKIPRRAFIEIMKHGTVYMLAEPKFKKKEESA